LRDFRFHYDEVQVWVVVWYDMNISEYRTAAAVSVNFTLEIPISLDLIEMKIRF